MPGFSCGPVLVWQALHLHYSLHSSLFVLSTPAMLSLAASEHAGSALCPSSSCFLSFSSSHVSFCWHFVFYIGFFLGSPWLCVLKMETGKQVRGVVGSLPSFVSGCCLPSFLLLLPFLFSSLCCPLLLSPHTVPFTSISELQTSLCCGCIVCACVHTCGTLVRSSSQVTI